jgi:anti-sigma regulatory factor (Ser/Thr protein kinase)/PAS domain-containing protein
MKKNIIILGIVLCIFAPSLPAAPRQEAVSPLYINLREMGVYVKKGFNPAEITGIPDVSSGGWMRVENPPQSSIPVSVMNLNLPEVPKRVFLSPLWTEEMEFTFMLPFYMRDEGLALLTGPQSPVPGVFLASLGDNWEIFLNGVPVRAEMHLDPQGHITSHRSQRQIFFPVDKLLFKAGLNILAIRIVGDPTYKTVGFFYASPYYIDNYETIVKRQDESLTLALSAVYIFVGLYHLFMFFSRRKDIYNCYYGLFSTVLGVYFLARTHTIYSLIPNTGMVVRTEFACLFLVFPLIAAFVEQLCIHKTLLITKIYGSIYGFMAFSQLFLALPYSEDTLKLWQIAALPIVIIICGYDIGYTFINTGLERWKQYKEKGERVSLPKIYGKVILNTPIGNIVLGSLFLVVTGVFDIFDSIFLHYGITATRYGFFVFTMSTTFILVRRFTSLYSQLSIVNDTLEERVKDLTNANILINRNEKKYRSLFDGSRDPVMILDENLRFRECNPAAVNFYDLEGLDLGQENSAIPTLPEKLYKNQQDRTVFTEIVVHGLQDIKQSKKPIELATYIKTPTGESKNCTLRIEYLEFLGKAEILVRTLVNDESSLTKAYVDGRERYDIQNTLNAANEVCNQACARLSRYLPAEDADFVMICLREIVLNAIEHGNLEITHDEKTKAQRSRTYFEFLQQRMENSRYKKRRVMVEYAVTPQRAIFRVTDQGKGFDHKKHTGNAMEPSPDMLEHGRGIFMAHSAFDSITYNEKGNQVTLEKHFSP